MNVEYLSLEDLLTLADDLGVPKVRDLGLLDAVAHRPRTSLMGHDRLLKRGGPADRVDAS